MIKTEKAKLLYTAWSLERTGCLVLLNLLIVLLLASALFTGYRRGLITQIVRLVGTIAAFAVALFYFRQLAAQLQSWFPAPHTADWQTLFYPVIAFVILFVLAKTACAFIGSFLNSLAHLPLIRPINRLAGALVGFLESYLLLLLLLYVASLLPVGVLHTAVGGSSLAQAMIGKTPLISPWLRSIGDVTGGVL
ncbi:MAG: CvpA family protein [Sporolactobacillus sp.]